MINLRIFVSSPGDVGEERRLTSRVIERLAFEWKGRVRLEPIFWEHEPLRASGGFQEQLPLPSDSDIVLCVLWSRLGTRLPPTLTREDGTRYASGTEFEFEDALRAYRRKGVPDLLVYRRTSRPLTELDSEQRVLERLEQKKALDAFVDRWFQHAEGYLTAAFHTFEQPAQFEKLLEQHLRRLIDERWRRAGGEEGAAPLVPWEAGSPFRGLRAFEREHAAVFCGRTAEVSEVLNALRRQDAAGRPFVLVVGMSGCGKSSLVRAGVLPELTFPNVIEGIGLWRVATLVPGRAADDLLGGLAQALLDDEALGELRQRGAAGDGTTPAELAELLRERPGAAVPLVRSGLARAAQRVQREENLPAEPAARLALLIDQLEELFTSERITADARRCFDAALATLVRSGAVWAIATLRSDFYARCTELEGLMALKEGAGQYDLKPPAGAALGHMIRQPARIAGLRFESSPTTGERLDDLLLNEAARDPEALPLLEFTLDELYRRRSDGGLLTFAAYRDLGGVEGALARRAEEVFLALSPDAQKALATMLPGLVTLDPEEGSVFTRRRSPYADLTAAPGARELVDSFVEHRLLVTDRAEDGTPVVSLAHEALLRRWPRAQAWLRDNDELLRACARLKMAAALWRQSGEEAGFLLREGELLATGRSLIAEGRVPVSEAEAALVRASEAAVAAERRRRRRWLAAGVAAASALAIGIFVYRHLYVDTYYRHHENFTLRNGVPEGVFPLGDADAGRRQWSLRFELRGRRGRVESIEAVNAHGNPTPFHTVSRHIAGFHGAQADLTNRSERECRWLFVYDDRGLLSSERGESCGGGTVYELLYKQSSDAGRKVVAEYVREGLATPEAESGAALIEFTRRPDGLDQRIRYLDVHGRPASDGEGSFGLLIEEYAASGLPHAIVNLGRDGFAAPHHFGFVRTTFAYDGEGRVARAEFGDQQGKPTMTRLGFASAEFGYDEYGNQVAQRLFGPDGQPAPAFARTQMTYDRQGNLVHVALFDGADKPGRDPAGWSGLALEYDQRGNPTALTTLDGDGEPLALRGFARTDLEYDESDNLVALSYRDADGRPVARQDGVARETYRYERGKVAETNYLDDQGRPVIPIEVGYATVRSTYDASQRLVEAAYFDPNGLPARNAEGVLRQRWTYDDDGHRSSVVYLDSAGEPMRSWRNEAEVRWHYDEAEDYAAEAYFDLDGQPVAIRDGYAAKWVRYQAGNVAQERYFDQGGEPAAIDGCYGIAYEHDVLGQEIQRKCLDENGEPSVFDGGFGGFRTAYDPYRNRIGLSYFSSHDPATPATPEGGVARTRWTYDRLGNAIEETYADESGQPTRHPEGHSRVETDYDVWGNAVEWRYLGPDGRLVRTAQGYARRTAAYGPRGEPIEIAHYDEHGGPASSPEGYARATFTYNSGGERTEVRFFDEGNRPLAGVARLTMEYEPDGTRTDTYHDAAGRVVGSATVHRFEETPEPKSPPRRAAPPARETARESRPSGGAVAPEPPRPQPESTGQPEAPPPPPPPPPPSGELADAIERLPALTERIQESYEEFLDAEDREVEGREEEIEDLLGELEDATYDLRKAYRGATGQSQGVGRLRSLVRERMGADQAALLRERAAAAVRLGDALAALVAEYPIGERAQGQWREIRSHLARVRAELM